MKIEDIKKGLSILGLEHSVVATVKSVESIGPDSLQVINQRPDGSLNERLVGRADEANICVATTEHPWSFDEDGDAFKLAVEVKRIDLAFLIDPMMEVHTSNVTPLPHEITVVYEWMLPRQPLRFGFQSSEWE
jgi:hypothetical protein